jgi:hypothetical protein
MVVCRDFNEILNHHEKEGGMMRSQTCMDHLKCVIEDCGLHDFGFVGDVFTWRNNQYLSENYVRERLDRALGNIFWWSLHPTFKVRNGYHYHSDHKPCDHYDTESCVRAKGKEERTFKFEEIWLEDKY